MLFICVHQGDLQALDCVRPAMLLGAAIGLKREIEDKPVDVRMHVLVASAAALVVALSDVTAKQFSEGMGGVHAKKLIAGKRLLLPLSVL